VAAIENDVSFGAHSPRSARISSVIVSIQEFADRLTAIPETRFTHAGVLEFLRNHRVELASLEPYLYFSRDHYTRHLIHRTDLFELLAICWDIGQKSAIHNHREQSCWMAAAYGKVQVHNFKLLRKDPPTGFCELESDAHFLITADSPQEVDPDEPIHQVLNPASFKSRAVTLHVYSKPFETCEVYDLKEGRYRDVRLVNTSEYGVLKTGIPLERIKLGSGACNT
jgi:cysteine dioxygenase